MSHTSPSPYPWGKGGGRGGSSLKGATFLSYKTSFKLNLLGGLISFPGQLFCRNAALLVPSLSPLSLKIKYYWGKCAEDATGERWAAPFPWYCFHIVLQKMLKSIFEKKLFRVTAYWLRGRAFNSQHHLVSPMCHSNGRCRLIYLPEWKNNKNNKIWMLNVGIAYMIALHSGPSCLKAD